ncbi:MAG: Na/Pi symporter, partial [Bacteroidetes bacterium]|nr:Na/Pi symporter [Bacteroidota bacterium]
GFAILFIGLQFLKESVPDINNNPDALNFLSSFTDLGFGSVLIFILVGTLLTIVIQSSSATMALTLVMCYNGLIPFELAAAMVLGENIGTTVTANIAAVVANVSAKRAARAHFIFNIFGVLWMVAVFHYFLMGIDLLMQQYHGISILNTHLSNADYEIIKNEYPVALAVFHTSFNIFNTLILIGFAPLIAKVATKMVPDAGEDDEEFRLKFINTGLFSTSEIAIIQARNEISTFGRRIEKMYSLTQILMTEYKTKKYYKILTKVEKYEQITDNLELEIAGFLTRVSEGELSHDSSKKIRAMLKIIDDMESVGDAIYQLSKVIDNAQQSKLKFTENQKKALREMFELVKMAFKEMNLNIEKEYHTVSIKNAYSIENKINEKRNQLRQQHVEDLKEKRYKHKTGTFYSDMFSIDERIGDYIINVSEAIQEYQDG